MTTFGLTFAAVLCFISAACVFSAVGYFGGHWKESLDEVGVHNHLNGLFIAALLMVTLGGALIFAAYPSIP